MISIEKTAYLQRFSIFIIEKPLFGPHVQKWSPTRMTTTLSNLNRFAKFLLHSMPLILALTLVEFQLNPSIISTKIFEITRFLLNLAKINKIAYEKYFYLTDWPETSQANQNYQFASGNVSEVPSFHQFLGPTMKKPYFWWFGHLGPEQEFLWNFFCKCYWPNSFCALSPIWLRIKLWSFSQIGPRFPFNYNGYVQFS